MVSLFFATALKLPPPRQLMAVLWVRDLGPLLVLLLTSYSAPSQLTFLSLSFLSYKMGMCLLPPGAVVS